MSVEAYVVRLCTESRLFLCVGDCAERCVNCAKGSKQLRGRARAQLRGNIRYVMQKHYQTRIIAFNPFNATLSLFAAI